MKSLSNVWTIGFTKTTAESFFGRLRDSGIKKLIDVRLHNTSQLSGFAKAVDLAFFLREIGNIGYEHQPLLAPTAILLEAYRIKHIGWDEYERQFMALLASRRIEDRLQPEGLDGSCFLCSENSPHHCHRRLVCDYLNAKWSGSLKIHHL